MAEVEPLEAAACEDSAGHPAEGPLDPRTHRRQGLAVLEVSVVEVVVVVAVAVVGAELGTRD